MQNNKSNNSKNSQNFSENNSGKNLRVENFRKSEEYKKSNIQKNVAPKFFGIDLNNLDEKNKKIVEDHLNKFSGNQKSEKDLMREKIENNLDEKNVRNLNVKKRTGKFVDGKLEFVPAEKIEKKVFKKIDGIKYEIISEKEDHYLVVGNSGPEIIEKEKEIKKPRLLRKNRDGKNISVAKVSGIQIEMDSENIDKGKIKNSFFVLEK